jgi:hypothetical protein
MTTTHDDRGYAEKYTADGPVNPPDEYKIGYGKPPKENQYQKGKSGNPSGRPKNRPDIRKSLYDDIDREMQKLIPDALRGNRKHITKWRKFVRQLVDDAADGDRDARRDLLQILKDSKWWAGGLGLVFVLEDSGDSQ